MFRAPLLILAAFSILYLVLIQYCCMANYRDPTSRFFDPTRAYKHIYSQERIKEADSFILSQDSRPSAIEHAVQTPVLCIGVATVARRGDQYVRRTIGSLLEGLSQQERGAIYMNLFLAHTDPAKHPVFGEKWVETLPNKIVEYSKSDIERVQEWETNGWYRNKTIFDYNYLLQDCYATGAPYIAMIEDDTLAVRGWYRVRWKHCVTSEWPWSAGRDRIGYISGYSTQKISSDGIVRAGRDICSGLSQSGLPS
ncbi:hypothetical protein GLAREA_12953 [Glarea lozoyensis ATCC 20868]|uniref:Uncharacterized protein n=1 Tax=Glarea lozoyensis (strain ATCC 20868 / MF5171) TaxID=1116229 RepID=S3CX91_GLAL2|nr:uncharacterized protein GLAREA_12953 [Glarea lozoyensis ATCC 20868]EPE30230.1 hypothetical protein GLAREA_12953 [Glarea lozoyensis ATCC 20868]